MELLFWVGQVGWVAFLACGAYVSFCFYDLADEEHARAAKPVARTMPLESAHAGFASLADNV